MSADVFGAPAPRAVRGKGRGQAYIDPAGIRRDRWDRPMLPDPVTGEVRPWTSVTTLARTMADVYNLGLWQQRMVARGLGIRHDLAALAANTDVDDKATLQSIASDAMEAAGSSTGRNTGNALHELTRTFDTVDTAGKTDLVRRARPDLAADIKAYARALDAMQLEVRSDLAERMTVCREVESAGTFDRIVTAPDGRMMIADLKTGQHANELGQYELAQQLAIYANGEALWRVLDPTTGEGVWEALPGEIDTSVGLLIWLPAGRAHCEIRPVDLTQGMIEARRSYEAGARRKEAKRWLGAPYYSTSAADTPPAAPEPPPSLPDGIREVIVLDVANALGRDAAEVNATLGSGAASATSEPEPLEDLLLARIAGAPDVPTLMDMARQHADVWTPDMQEAAAGRWAALQV